MAKKTTDEPTTEKTTTTEPEVEETPAPTVLGATPMTEPITPLAATPTPETELGFSYEFGTDIKIEDVWQKIRFSSNANPSFSPKEVDGATYDDEGADHPIKVGESGQLDLTVQQHRIAADGKFLPEMEAILAAAAPDANGNKASVPVRYYDNPASGKPNPNEAYELQATVTVARAQTGLAEVGGWNVTFKAQGPRKRIANPAISTGE